MMTDSMPLEGLRLLTFVDDIYEDLELWYPKLRMIEAGARVTVAGPEAGVKYAGKNGYPCVSDTAIRDMGHENFDGVIVPGGFMPDKLRRDPKVLELVRGFADSRNRESSLRQFVTEDGFLYRRRCTTVCASRVRRASRTT